MKLLVVCQVVDAEHQNLGFFVRWIEEFAKRCESVTVIANEVGTYSLPANVAVHSLGKEKGTRRLERYQTFYALLKKLKGEYSHVFCHMNPEFVIAGALVWRRLKIPIILWYVHGTVSLRLRLALRIATAACTTDEKSLRLKSKKIHRVGHGIDTEYFVPVPHTNTTPQILSVSRLSPAKHIDLIIDATAGLSAETTIIGGPATASDELYYQELQKKVASTPSITLTGPKNHQFVHDALKSADVFVNASTTGSMDKVVLEAAASGVLPISSNIAFKPMLEPYGLFVSALTVEAFRASIQHVLSHPDRAEVGAALRVEVVKNHNLRQCVERILTVYERS